MKMALKCTALLFILLFFSSTNFAQAPTLGTVADFVLFTSNGAVSNTGTSQLTGNVGTNIGSTTGFGNVNGVMHSGDGASSTCANDLTTLYNQLNNKIPTMFPSPLLGNGDTLIAGVYKISGVTTFSGKLILDAQGNGNAIFIFQVQAAFSSNVGAKLVLANGAQACNVFWKIEGMVSLASQTFMRGTIVANNAAIDMSTNDTLEGRAVSTTGAVTISGILAYMPIGCGSPQLNGPAAPNLGSAACFAIFSGNGSVTNAGSTHVTGDIGSNVGLTTGYDPLLVNGNIHSIPDGTTSACASDLVNAYNYLNALPYNIELLYPAQFGNNLVLTPHTYLMNAATSFTGNVYLNAQGNSNAVFVLQINGALSTSTFSRVVLMNGAQARNVYWKVDGAVTVSDYSIFNGTIVCNNGALNLNTGDSLNGRALTTSGAIHTAAFVATNPDGVCAPLPVNLLYFKGSAMPSGVLLEWANSSYMNNGIFNVEKSRDGTAFSMLGSVSAGGIAINGEYHYSINDLDPYSITYYRLTHIDINGQNKSFQIIQVKANASHRLAVKQSVHDGAIQLQVIGAEPGKGNIDLFSIDGRKLSAQNVVITKDLNMFIIKKPVQKGIYILNMESNGATLYNGKIVVQ